MRLIITRHGETEENIHGIIQGHLHGKLSKLGIEQIKKIANRIKDKKIDYIYSSDLNRASDTAKEIAKSHLETPLEFVKELRERNLGEFQGIKRSDLKKDGKDFTVLRPKKGETMKQVYYRAEKFLHKILLKHSHDTILFVGHNGINKAMIAVITGKNVDEIISIEKQHNTALNIFEIDENKNHKIICYNCDKHLK